MYLVDKTKSVTRYSFKCISIYEIRWYRGFDSSLNRYFFFKLIGGLYEKF